MSQEYTTGQKTQFATMISPQRSHLLRWKAQIFRRRHLKQIFCDCFGFRGSIYCDSSSLKNDANFGSLSG
jgi:hypothetical protein